MGWKFRGAAKKALFAIALLAGVAFAGISNAQVYLDFEDGTDLQNVSSFYAGKGVVFSAKWRDMGGSPLAGMSGTKGILSPTGAFQFFKADAVVATFSSPVQFVSILGLDVGANGLRMDAYDAATGGNLVGFQEVYGTGNGVGQYFTLQIPGTAIRRVEIYQIQNNVSGEGVLLDNLRFNLVSTPVPALSEWGVLILGGVLALSTGVYLRRRRS